MEREISEAAAFLPVVVTMGAAALVALVCGAIAPTVVVGLPLWVTRWVPAVIYGGGALVAFVMVSLPLRVPRPD